MSNPLHRAHPWNWFTRRPAYIKFMVREVTALFVGAYLIFLLVVLRKLGAGEEAFVEYLGVLTSPLSVLLHLLVLAAAVFHSVTWFNLTPKAMPVFWGENRVADPLVAFGIGYLPWIIVTLLIVWGVRS